MGYMTAYNAVNGVPMSANGRLINDLARKEWGFDGVVITDCGVVEDLWLRHKYVANGTAAARTVLENGVDVECGGTIAYSATPGMKELLQKAAESSFTVRFRLGEFDPPPPSAAQQQREEALYDRAAHAKLAYEAAVQSAVLLKNDRQTLPFATGTRLAVMGPLKDASWEALGSYSGYMDGSNWSHSPNVISPLNGLRSCQAAGEIDAPTGGPHVCSLTEESVAGSQAHMQKPAADAVVIVAGLYCQDEQTQDVDRRPESSGKCQSGCLEVEGCDRPGLDLPRGQRQLIRRAKTWGLPVVLVLLTGGPVDLTDYAQPGSVDAILWMGYPGQAAGTALARLLFGFASPSGRLPQTFYTGSYADALSITEMNMRPNPATGYPGRSYRFVDPQWVVYPFGYGLSYHQWDYKWLPAPQPEPSTWVVCSLSLIVSLSAAGRASDEPSSPVLLFLVPPAGVGTPQRQLRQFERVQGARSSLTFVLAREDFELADEQGHFHLTHGMWWAEVNVPAALRIPLYIDAKGCRQ